MFNDNVLNFAGNMTADPELKFGQTGKPHCAFTIMVNDTPPKDGNRDDAKSHAIRCRAFGSTAENLARSAHKGTRVLVTGRFDSYQEEGLSKDGQPVNRTFLTVIADTVAVDLRWQVAEVSKANSNSNSNSRVQQAPQAPSSAALAPEDEF